MRSRSFISPKLAPVIVLVLVIAGLVAGGNASPVLCIAAAVGCAMLLLLLTVLKNPALGFLRTVFDESTAARVQSGPCIGAVGTVALGLGLVWLLWDDSRLVSGHLLIATLSVLFACVALRLHPNVLPEPPQAG